MQYFVKETLLMWHFFPWSIEKLAEGGEGESWRERWKDGCVEGGKARENAKEKKNRTDRKLREEMGKTERVLLWMLLAETINLYLNLTIAIGKGKQKSGVLIMKSSVGNFARLVDAVLRL